MTPEQWRRVKELLAEAIALDTAGQRALVEREFGEDPQLREEVQDLLTTFSLSTLRLPPALAAAGDGAILPPLRPQSEGLRLEPGDMCGRYAVERVLGAGGMARVYLATDTELSTPVALKVTGLPAREPAVAVRVLAPALFPSVQDVAAAMPFTSGV